MDFFEYRTLVKMIPTGKSLPDAIYIHESCFGQIPEKLAVLALETIDQFKVRDNSWNLIKFFKRDFKIAYLNYPSFEEDSYPELKHSQLVDLQKLSLRKSDYSKSDNPPILHRKETFVSETYPLKGAFEAITAEGEAIGLYKNSNRIGFKKNWERLIKKKGYYLDDEGHLQPLAEKPIPEANNLNLNGEVERHRTAIDRNTLSQPVQALARHNYLNGNYSLLDYGCGKGDDVRELEAHGIDVLGWDPNHRQTETLENKDLVNLGFVLNVIEDRTERTETLAKAWKYADKILVVAVMVAGESTINQFQPYKDGIITSRNTFQKYYSQAEIRYYIESNLEESAIAVGQGIFLIFKDKVEEQHFLSERQHVKRDWTQKTQRQLALKPKTVKRDIIDQNIDLFEDYWQTTLDLGRIPANNEFEFSDQVRRICGSHIKAQQALLRYFGDTIFKEAESKRKEDLLVYFALCQFEKRKPQSKMPESLRRDIKAFFSSYQEALEVSLEVLFSVGKPATIYNACVTAYASLRCGHLEEGHSFTFHRNYLGDLPVELRIYIGCATQLYGDIENFELVKAHIRSGKVSLMRYDDWSKDEPLLLERIKIKLRELDIDFFEYSGNFEPPPLVNKKLF